MVEFWMGENFEFKWQDMAAPILLTGEVALEGLVLVIVIVEDDDLAQAPVHAVVLAQVIENVVGVQNPALHQEQEEIVLHLLPKERVVPVLDKILEKETANHLNDAQEVDQRQKKSLLVEMQQENPGQDQNQGPGQNLGPVLAQHKFNYKQNHQKKENACFLFFKKNPHPFFQTV
jgi:hypothetical protein